MRHASRRRRTGSTVATLVSALGASLASTAAVGVAWWQHTVAPFRPDTALVVSTLRGAQIAQRDTDIAVWNRARAADTGSALVLSQLAALHAARAREQGTAGDWTTAEALARHALARRTHRNGAAAATLVSTLLAQHRFIDAAVAARALVLREPDVPVYRAILGDVAMELGDTTTARAMFASVYGERRELAIAPRYARWRELTGEVGDARSLLRLASDSARTRHSMSPDTRAWFALRRGDLERRAGDARSAAMHYRDGLRESPGDARLLTAMARLAADDRRAHDALWWAEQAVAARTEPATLLALGVAFEAVGDTTRARETMEAVAQLESATRAPAHRELMLWHIDHASSAAQADSLRRRAAEALHTRRDVYGYDLAAWASHRSGHVHDARRYMRAALALGTVDQLLLEHARAILETP